MNTFQLERKGRSKLPSVADRSRKDDGSFNGESENYKLEVTSQQNVFRFSCPVMFISSNESRKTNTESDGAFTDPDSNLQSFNLIQFSLLHKAQ